MNYTELSVSIFGAEQAEIATAMLADLPYESFDDNDPHSLKAYIRTDLLDDIVRAATAEALSGVGLAEWSFADVAPQNWNREWESGFTPVAIDHRAIIRAPHHGEQSEYAMQILISPRMAFGSGHHATTAMLVGMILDAGMEGARCADIGCGTGVLAIAAAKCGAAAVDAVDIDAAAVENASDNVRENGLEGRVMTALGTVDRLAGNRYDVIFANINRNILLHDMPSYAALLAPQGRLFVSGFYTGDLTAVADAALLHGLALSDTRECNGWSALLFTKRA